MRIRLMTILIFLLVLLILSSIIFWFVREREPRALNQAVPQYLVQVLYVLPML